MSKRDFKKLEREWYDRLKASGFDDIEDTEKRNRPLKEYHSFYFPSADSEIRRAKRMPYQAQVDNLRHSTMFKEVSGLIRASIQGFTKKEVQMIWEMHCEGKTERAIASTLSCSKTKIHKILEKYRQWLNLV